MPHNKIIIQNEFKDLLAAHFDKRRASGSSRSKWPDEVVEKFGELVGLGYDAKFFESTFGLLSHQYYSLRLRLKPKSTKAAFKKLKVEKPQALPFKHRSTLYLRSASGVELRGIQDFNEALALFVKAAL